MTLRKRTHWILSLVAIIAAVAWVGATIASGTAESGGVAGQIDDGAEHLDQASISLDEAIAAAQAAYTGALDAVELESYQGRLVFNVEIGDKDVMVDAEDGRVLGYVSDLQDQEPRRNGSVAVEHSE